jgi:spore coat protein CotF
MYSNPCNTENNKPNVTVINKEITLTDLLFLSKAWWHQVIDTPDDSNNSVLSNGMLIGLKAMISCGGQLIPNSILGEILL